MKSAFSMIELIFIIVIIGILGATMQMNMPDNRLFSDINFITQKIKSKQIYALSYDNFDYENSQFIDDSTCITISRDFLNEDERNSSKANPYQISSYTTLSIGDENLCFDNLGRVYKLNNLLKLPIELNITYKNKTKTVNIMPLSGSVVVNK